MSHILFACGHILYRGFEDLEKGDPLAIGIVVVFLLFLAVVGLVAFSPNAGSIAKMRRRRTKG